jgi:hypothetical protein
MVLCCKFSSFNHSGRKTMIKHCVGCLKEIKDTMKSLGIATICDSCKIPLEKIPQKTYSRILCQNCGGGTNLIGAFRKDDLALLYFDCPNLICSDKRMTIKLVGMIR